MGGTLYFVWCGHRWERHRGGKWQKIMNPISLAFSFAQFAPSILRFLGAGDKSVDVANKVCNIAQQVSECKSPEDALSKITADAELSNAFRLEILKRDSEFDMACFQDVKDARKRDVDLAKTGRHNIRADVMVAIDAIGLIACLCLLGFFKKELPPEAISLITTIASIFGLCLRDAHNFEFGSSRGSREKDAIIANSTPNQPD